MLRCLCRKLEGPFQLLNNNFTKKVQTVSALRAINTYACLFVNERDRERGSRQKITAAKEGAGLNEIWDFLPDEVEALEQDGVTKTTHDDGGIFVYGGAIYMPGPETDEVEFGGIKYKNLPVINIKAGWNNTLICVSTIKLGRRRIAFTTSCGQEGFKNAKKATNIASQSTGLACAMKCLKRGMTDVRVAIRGLGPGRMSAVKGVQMGGVNIVSISDHSYYNTGLKPPRPRSV